MKKRKRNIVVLMLLGCLILSNGISVSAKEIASKLGDGTVITLSVSKGEIWAWTYGNNPRTRVSAYRYPFGGSPNQLIAMTPVQGNECVHLTPPSGWSIGKGSSTHSNGEFSATLTAFP